MFDLAEVEYVTRISGKLAMSDGLIIIDDDFILKFINAITVGDGNVVDECARVRSGKNQAHFLNATMNYVIAVLLDMVSINRQGVDVAMSNSFLGILSFF